MQDMTDLKEFCTAAVDAAGIAHQQVVDCGPVAQIAQRIAARHAAAVARIAGAIHVRGAAPMRGPPPAAAAAAA